MLQAEYAVRGEIALLAEDLRAKTHDPKQKEKLPFDEVVSCNIGASIALLHALISQATRSSSTRSR